MMSAAQHARDHHSPKLGPMRYRLPLFVLVLTLAPSGHVRADDLMNIDLSIKDHRFTPTEIHVPAGKPVTLTIKNEDSTVEEFDSLALKVEKVIVGGRTATLRLRPLGAGRYPFMGEYHSDTAQGVVIAE
jgi:heme/copper-type cytochrome/quinol oxidase subunit 2